MSAAVLRQHGRIRERDRQLTRIHTRFTQRRERIQRPLPPTGHCDGAMPAQRSKFPERAQDTASSRAARSRHA